MTKLNEQTKSLALEELKLLSALISKQEEFRLTTRGWSLAILTGLTIAHLNHDLSVGRATFLLLGLGIIVSGWIIEAWYSMAQLGAMDRSLVVEQFLRGDCSSYDGPRIATDLGPQSEIRS